MRIRIAVPEAHVGPDVIDSALEAVTRTNESLLRSGVVPPADHAIAAGVKWRPEPPGDEHFDPATTVVARGHGDCDDLAPYVAATRRVTGEDPLATARVVETHPGNFHAIVQRSDGSIEDPSAEAGMHGYRPPVQPRMAEQLGKPHVSVRVVGNGVAARCDVPWLGTRMAISGHGFGQSYAEAIQDAVQGACVVGQYSGAIAPEHAARLMALNALLSEADPHEVAAVLQAWGMPHASKVVGSIFSSLANIAKSALPIASSFVPIPGAGLAGQALASMIPGGGGGGHHAAAPAQAAAPGVPFSPGVPPGAAGFPERPPIMPIIVKF